MAKLTIDDLGAPNAARRIAMAVMERQGEGTWNAARSAEACALVACAVFDADPDGDQAAIIRAAVALQGVGCNNSAFSIWATTQPKGASEQNVPGVTRQSKGARQESDVASILARLKAKANPEPEGE